MIDTQKAIGNFYGQDPYFKMPDYMTQQRELPNGGGSYSVAGAASSNPNNQQFLDSLKSGYSESGERLFTPVPTQGSGNTAGNQQVSQGSSQPEVDLYSKYRDPKTGEIMSPDQYALYLGSRVPAQTGNGDIPQYAGDAMTNPNASVKSLTDTSYNLNNARNDIATGTTDPYKVGNQSGIAYSPSELKAIENAYAGVYDPALNDVFSRLKTKEEEAKKESNRADAIFATDEAIRKWKATTGLNSGEDGSVLSTKDRFSTTQLNQGSIKAGMSLAQFTELDPEVANYFVNPPKGYDSKTGDTFLISDSIADAIKEIEDGVKTKEEVAEEIMAGEHITDEVKVYLINKLPATQEEKDGFIKKILKLIW